MKINRLYLFLILVATLFFLSACSVEKTPPPSGSVLFEDDFADQESEWPTTLQPDGSMIGYQAGGLRFVINSPQQDYYSVRNKDYQNVILEVNAMKLNGPDDNLFGLICRWQDRDNYYAGLVSSDGYYAIGRVIDGDYQTISDEMLELADDVILKDIAVNHIKFSCVDQMFALEVNDEVLSITQDDSALRDGKIGLIAGSNQEAAVDILFDLFRATQP
ncbi:MAG: hypothetical protein JW750_07220 [Anaerolineaceae bacterium]|nr:hypothetical protein [Anaerolineaceae bacterium]